MYCLKNDARSRNQDMGGNPTRMDATVCSTASGSPAVTFCMGVGKNQLTHRVQAPKCRRERAEVVGFRVIPALSDHETESP